MLHLLDVGALRLQVTLEEKMNFPQYRLFRLLVISLWLTVSALIDLTGSVIMCNTEWGTGLPPADYIENLGNYQLT